MAIGRSLECNFLALTPGDGRLRATNVWLVQPELPRSCCVRRAWVEYLGCQTIAPLLTYPIMMTGNCNKTAALLSNAQCKKC